MIHKKGKKNRRGRTKMKKNSLALIKHAPHPMHERSSFENSYGGET